MAPNNDGTMSMFEFMKSISPEYGKSAESRKVESDGGVAYVTPMSGLERDMASMDHEPTWLIPIHKAYRSLYKSFDVNDKQPSSWLEEFYNGSKMIIAAARKYENRALTSKQVEYFNAMFETRATGSEISKILNGFSSSVPDMDFVDCIPEVGLRLGMSKDNLKSAMRDFTTYVQMITKAFRPIENGTDDAWTAAAIAMELHDKALDKFVKIRDKYGLK